MAFVPKRALKDEETRWSVSMFGRGMKFSSEGGWGDLAEDRRTWFVARSGSERIVCGVQQIGSVSIGAGR